MHKRDRIVETPEDIAKYLEERRKKFPKAATPQSTEEQLPLPTTKEEALHDFYAKEDLPTTRQVCKYYAGGKCRHGNQCRNIHEKLREVVKRPLMESLAENERKRMQARVFSAIDYIVDSNFFSDPA